MCADKTLALLAWLSPAYPVGAYAYSHGLEWAAEAGDIKDLQTLVDWISDILTVGSGRNDAILFVQTWRDARSGGGGLVSLAELAIALAPSRERRLEALQQGAAFLNATRAAWPHAQIDRFAEATNGQSAYCIAFAVAAAAHDVPLRPALDSFLSAFASNLVSAAVRLNVIGQTDGQRAVAVLTAVAQQVAETVEHSSLDDLGGSAFRADIAAMRHETQHARLFRS
jgi:urease accessory protein